MPNDTHVTDVNDVTFKTDVLERSHELPVVVDFWAPWCGPCKQLGPVLEQLAEERGGDWLLAKINVDDNPQAAQSFNVRGIPAVKAFVDGEVVGEFTGAKPRPRIEQWLDRIVPSESDRKIDEAREALETGKLDDAEQLFEQILEESRYAPPASVGLAKVALERGDVNTARERLGAIPEGMEDEADGEFEHVWLAVEAAGAPDPDELRPRIEEDPNDLEARYQLAVRLADEGAVEPALEQLLEIVKRDRDFEDDLGRRAMLRLFEVIGPDTDRVREWRKKLGRAMY